MAQLLVVGGARLRRTMKQAGANMKDLKGLNKETAGIVATAAKPLAPVASGKLKKIYQTVGNHKGRDSPSRFEKTSLRPCRQLWLAVAQQGTYTLHQ